MQKPDTYNVVASTSAAERNKEPIREALSRLLPSAGVVLEVASGAGTHVAHLARAFPSLTFQPSELSADDLPRVDAAAASLANVRPAVQLDLCDARLPSAVQPASLTMVFAVNVCHISPYDATLGLLQLASTGLSPGGLLVIYGPFLVDGVATPESNAAFDRSLRERNPAWGYRDRDVVFADGERFGLQRVDAIAMPANNLLLVLRKDV